MCLLKVLDERKIKRKFNERLSAENHLLLSLAIAFETFSCVVSSFCTLLVISFIAVQNPLGYIDDVYNQNCSEKKLAACTYAQSLGILCSRRLQSMKSDTKRDCFSSCPKQCIITVGEEIEKQHGSRPTERVFSLEQPAAVLIANGTVKSTGVRASDGQSRGNCSPVYNACKVPHNHKCLVPIESDMDFSITISNSVLSLD